MQSSGPKKVNNKVCFIWGAETSQVNCSAEGKDGKEKKNLATSSSASRRSNKKDRKRKKVHDLDKGGKKDPLALEFGRIDKKEKKSCVLSAAERKYRELGVGRCAPQVN